MQVDYKKKILLEIEKVSDEKLANMYRIVHLLTGELMVGTKKTGKRVSLKKSLFPDEQ